MTTPVTPTRLPGTGAALARAGAALSFALSRIPAWQGVSVVMACAAAAMVIASPTPLIA